MNRLHKRYIEYYLSKYDVDLQELVAILSGLKHDEDFSEFKFSGKVFSLEEPEGLFVSGKNGVLIINKSDYTEDMKSGDILRVIDTYKEQADYLVLYSSEFESVFYGIISRMWKDLNMDKWNKDLQNIWNLIIIFMHNKGISIANDFEYRKIVLFRC